MERRYRLTRSRDFDAVYRHGRSVSTRFLTLYWFERGEDELPPRLGLATPKALGSAVRRNRLKRQLREAWRMKEPQPGRDYVLVGRGGLPEAAEAQGLSWLRERIDEVLERAS
ncbi:MAG: ribonuclease P protein component [Gaiellaceae bacterium]